MGVSSTLREADDQRLHKSSPHLDVCHMSHEKEAVLSHVHHGNNILTHPCVCFLRWHGRSQQVVLTSTAEGEAICSVSIKSKSSSQLSSMPGISWSWVWYVNILGFFQMFA